jgi:dTDP-4-amino-4,6-dideoxygalactose transaminase
MQIAPAAVSRAIGPRTKAIVPVHYAGQPCSLDEILAIAGRAGIHVVEDAAHAAGAEYQGRRIGAHGRAVCFSFYATKNLTTGEGGMIATNDAELSARLRLLALHGMSRDAWKRYTEAGSWYYEVLEAGYKCNMTDIQAAMGIHQLRRLDGFIRRRQEIAARYDEAFARMPEIVTPSRLPGRNHTYHLYAIQLRTELLNCGRGEFIDEMRNQNIGCSVHFIPLHRHPLYRDRWGYAPKQFPETERIYAGLVSVPLYPRMSDRDAGDVIAAVHDTVARHRRGASAKQREEGITV